MKIRRNVNKRSSSKKFRKATSRTRKINLTGGAMRGGIRL